MIGIGGVGAGEDVVGEGQVEEAPEGVDGWRHFVPVGQDFLEEVEQQV